MVLPASIPRVRLLLVSALSASRILLLRRVRRAAAVLGLGVLRLAAAVHLAVGRRHRGRGAVVLLRRGGTIGLLLRGSAARRRSVRGLAAAIRLRLGVRGWRVVLVVW